MRDESKVYNTNAEPRILSPENDHYQAMATDCVKQHIAVDLFVTYNALRSVDIASLAPIASLTGGEVYFYPKFDVNKHGEKLHYELFRNLTRTQGSDVVMKARTSSGFTVTEYFGGFTFKETVDFELSAIDADKGLAFILRNDDKLKEGEQASI